ncbi:MAG: LysM peptidoglycan-binding domain-containing protein [Elusimicrobiaceae bacterium]|jgi:LysM repeat protein
MSKLIKHIVLSILVSAGGAAFAADASTATVHRVVRGDTLWALSGKYCKTPENWRGLYESNKASVKNPDLIFPGETLEIICSSSAMTVVHISANSSKRVARLAGAGKSAKTVSSDKVPVSKSDREDVAPPMILPEPEPELVPAKPGPDEVLLGQLKTLADKKGLVDERDISVSEAMPEDMTWGFPSRDTQLVDPRWIQDGVVSSANVNDDPMDVLAEFGDKITLHLNKKGKITAGDFLTVYRRGSVIKNNNGDKRLELQRSALLKVESVDGTTAVAQIVRVINPVETGDLVKK